MAGATDDNLESNSYAQLAERRKQYADQALFDENESSRSKPASKKPFLKRGEGRLVHKSPEGTPAPRPSMSESSLPRKKLTLNKPKPRAISSSPSRSRQQRIEEDSVEPQPQPQLTRHPHPRHQSSEERPPWNHSKRLTASSAPSRAASEPRARPTPRAAVSSPDPVLMDAYLFPDQPQDQETAPSLSEFQEELAALREDLSSQKSKMGVVLEIVGKEMDDLKAQNGSLEKKLQITVSKCQSRCDELEKSKRELEKRLMDAERTRAQAIEDVVLGQQELVKRLDADERRWRDERKALQQRVKALEQQQQQQLEFAAKSTLKQGAKARAKSASKRRPSLQAHAAQFLKSEKKDVARDSNPWEPANSNPLDDAAAQYLHGGKAGKASVQTAAAEYLHGGESVFQKIPAGSKPPKGTQGVKAQTVVGEMISKADSLTRPQRRNQSKAGPMRTQTEATASKENQTRAKAGLVRTQMEGTVSEETQESIKAGLVRTQMEGTVSEETQESIKAALKSHTWEESELQEHQSPHQRDTVLNSSPEESSNFIAVDPESSILSLSPMESPVKLRTLHDLTNEVAVVGAGSPKRSQAAISTAEAPSQSLELSVVALQKQLKQRLRTSGQLFYASDGNRDNKLSLEEFSRGVALMGVRPVPSKSEMQALFNAYDTDGDGWVQWSELSRFDESKPQQVPQEPQRGGDSVLSTRTDSRGRKEIVYADGRTIVEFSNGTKKETLSAGEVRILFPNGDVKHTNVEGIVKYFYADVKAWQTTFADGSELLEFESGQVERHFTDGTKQILFQDKHVRVSLPDGTEQDFDPGEFDLGTFAVEVN